MNLPPALAIAALTGILAFPVSTWATTINYTATRKGTSNTWTYTFSVVNTMSQTIEVIDIGFDFDLFSNLNKPVKPQNWYAEANDPYTFVDPETLETTNFDGNFYAEYQYSGSGTFTGGVRPNTTQSGFSVEADYRFSTTPPALPFSMYKISFGALELAYGVTGQEATVVPAPASAALFLTGLLAAATRWRRRKS